MCFDRSDMTNLKILIRFIPKVTPSKDIVEEVIDKLLSTPINEIETNETTKQIQSINKILSQSVENEDEDEEFKQNNKKIQKKGTIVDLLTNDTYSRDYKITLLDEKITSLFYNHKLKVTRLRLLDRHL